MARVLIISDTQAPFHHADTIPFLKSVYAEFKCDTVVHIGDEIDNKFLKYASINDPHTASEQHTLAIEFLHRLWAEFPKMMICNSNHVYDRLMSQAESANIPEFMLKSQHEYLKAPRGVRWADEWIIDNVKYIHGHNFGGVKPHVIAVQQYFMSVVMGHHPILGVQYLMKNGKQFFGMCVGSMTINLNDAHMGYGMKYSKRYAKEMPLGCGVVIDGKEAYAVPFSG